jgi:GT2 family glycosyltransferase
VVVDDGSGPETEAVLVAASARGGLPLRAIRHETAQGPGAARNAAWRAGHAPLVVFTDDDCVPTPGWLAGALAAAASRPGAVIQGRTEPDPAERHRDGLFSRTVCIQRLGPHYETCNILYPRTVLERLHGFDENFGLAPGGEDTDLAWRAIELGVPTAFAPEALVHHAVERLGPMGSLRVAARWTETVRIFASHPQLRRYALVRGVFWNVWHYLLLRSALTVVAPRWLRRFLLFRHTLELRRRARRGGAGTWAVAFLILHDVVELWAVVRGAARYRTFVI